MPFDIIDRVRRIQELLLIDRPLFYALAARVWQAISGPITIALIVSQLDPTETGLYYGLGAIMGIQVFFDLGLINLLISQAGHAVATNRELQAASNDTLLAENASRLSELIRASERWFFGASLVFGLAALAIGWSTLESVDRSIDWQTIFLPLVALNVISFALLPSQAILEGVGQRELVYRFRLLQAMTGSLIVWLSLAMGFKLWTLVASAVTQAGWMIYLRYFHAADFFRECRATTRSASSFSWLRDIVPVQWRLALVSVAYFLATQFLVLIVLTYESEEAAGRLGITLSMVTAIQMFALAWLQTNFSSTAIQHGSGNREQAGTFWRKLAVVSTTILVAALAVLTLLVACLPMFGASFEHRFISPAQLAVLSIGCVANHLISTQSFYVLSRRAPPILIASVVGFLVTALVVWMSGALYGVWGIVIAYAAAIALVALPLHSLAYLRFRKSVAFDS